MCEGGQRKGQGDGGKAGKMEPGIPPSLMYDFLQSLLYFYRQIAFRFTTLESRSAVLHSRHGEHRVRLITTAALCFVELTEKPLLVNMA